MTAVVIVEDPALPHQIRIRYRGGLIAVSCTCLNTRDGIWEMAWKTAWKNPAWRGTRLHGMPIEARTEFPADEAIAAWRAWHAAQGIEVTP